MTATDLSDFDTLKDWLTPFSKQKRSMLMCRANLRVFQHLCLFPFADPEDILVPCFRALITSAAQARGFSGPYSKKLRGIGWKAEQAIDAAAADSPADFPGDSAGYAVSGLRRSTGLATDTIAEAAQSAEEAAPGKGAAAMHRAVLADGNLAEDAPVWGPVWAKGTCPRQLRKYHRTFLMALEDDSDWVFWRRWYKEMRKGTWEDWGMVQEVALIEKKVWKSGKKAVAKRIRRIGKQRADLVQAG